MFLISNCPMMHFNHVFVNDFGIVVIHILNPRKLYPMMHCNTIFVCSFEVIVNHILTQENYSMTHYNKVYVFIWD